jgi:hypothetical protein
VTTRIAHGTRSIRAPFGAAALVRAAAASLLCLALLIGPALAGSHGSNNGGSNNGGGNSGGGNSGGSNNGGSNNGGGNSGGSNNGGSNNGGSNNGASNNAGGNGKAKGQANAAPAGESSEPEDANAALGLREAGRIHPLADAYNLAEGQFGGKVIDATLALHGSRTWTYDLRLVTDDGRVRTLSYDATTLALLAVDGEPVE